MLRIIGRKLLFHKFEDGSCFSNLSKLKFRAGDLQIVNNVMLCICMPSHICKLALIVFTMSSRRFLEQTRQLNNF